MYFAKYIFSPVIHLVTQSIIKILSLLQDTPEMGTNATRSIIKDTSQVLHVSHCHTWIPRYYLSMIIETDKISLRPL